MMVTIGETRTFTSDGGGLPVSRSVAVAAPHELPRTPPPPMAVLMADEMGKRWLLATGVQDEFSGAIPSGVEGRFSPGDVDPDEELGRAWVAATTTGWLS